MISRRGTQYFGPNRGNPEETERNDRARRQTPKPVPDRGNLKTIAAFGAQRGRTAGSDPMLFGVVKKSSKPPSSKNQEISWDRHDGKVVAQDMARRARRREKRAGEALTKKIKDISDITSRPAEPQKLQKQPTVPCR